MLDLGQRLERTEGELERTGQEDRPGGVGERERLLGRHRVRRRWRRRTRRSRRRPGRAATRRRSAGRCRSLAASVAGVGRALRRGRGRARAARRAARCRRPSVAPRSPTKLPTNCHQRVHVDGAAAAGRSLVWSVGVWSMVVMAGSPSSKASRVDAGRGRRVRRRRLRGDCNRAATPDRGPRCGHERHGSDEQEARERGSRHGSATSTWRRTPGVGVVQRHGRHHRAVRADRHVRQQPGVEGAGGLPRAALPRGDRRPAAATAAPDAARRPAGLRRPRAGRRHPRGDGPPRASSGPCSSGSASAPGRRSSPPHLHPERVARGGGGRAVGTGPRRRRSAVRLEAAQALRGGARRLLRAGRGNNRHVPGPTHWPDVRRVLLRPDAARAALHQAARGRRRLHLRDHGHGDPGRERRAALPRDREEAEAAAARDLPHRCSSIQGHRRPLPATGPQPTAWSAGPAREHLVLEGAGHLPMARHPVVVNRAIKALVDRVNGPPTPDACAPSRSRRRPRVLYLLLAHRPRTRAARPRRRRRDARAAPGRRGRVAHPVARRGVPGEARRGRSTRPRGSWRASPGTSRRSPASTTCTRSTPYAAWTRCWSTTSWSSTTWSSESPSTCGSATRRGTSTTSSTSTPRSSARRSSG